MIKSRENACYTTVYRYLDMLQAGKMFLKKNSKGDKNGSL